MHPIAPPRRSGHPAAASIAALLLLAGNAAAQTNTPEAEPNDTKAQATPANSGGPGMAPGDTLTGATTGASTSTAGATSADYFRVKTAAAPLGIYRHRLTLTSATLGQTSSLRGLNQTGSSATGGLVGTNDATFQTNITSPTRFVQWFGFGRQEEVFYRVVGVASTTAGYTATLSTTPVSPTNFGQPVGAGPVTIQRAAGNAADVDYWLYDANLNPIPGAGRDDGAPNATITTNLSPGTYTLAVGLFNTANNQPSPPGESAFSIVLDFPNVIASNSTNATGNLTMRLSSGLGGFDTPPLNTGGPFEVAFVRFDVVSALGASGTVTPPAAINDGTASVLFQVAVSPASTPPSTGIAATIDLSPLGGSPTATLFDDGTNGDTTAGDNTFSLTFPILAGTTPGTSTPTFTVTDAQGRSVAGTIDGPLIFTTPTATDLGTLPIPSLVTTNPTLAPAQINWFQFTLADPINAPSGRFLDIDTEGSANLDTEIGLYRPDGTRIADDDDDGAGLHSQLTFGFGPRPAVGTGLPYDGRDGTLSPGTYYLALGLFNTTFGNTAFAVSSASGLTGTAQLNLRAGFGPCGIVATPASLTAGAPGQPVLVSARINTFCIGAPGLSVSADLSPLGLAPAVPLNDNGTDGDQTAGDGVFSRAVTVPTTTPPADYTIVHTLDDGTGVVTTAPGIYPLMGGANCTTTFLNNVTPGRLPDNPPVEFQSQFGRCEGCEGPGGMNYYAAMVDDVELDGLEGVVNRSFGCIDALVRNTGPTAPRAWRVNVFNTLGAAQSQMVGNQYREEFIQPTETIINFDPARYPGYDLARFQLGTGFNQTGTRFNLLPPPQRYWVSVVAITLDTDPPVFVALTDAPQGNFNAFQARVLPPMAPIQSTMNAGYIVRGEGLIPDCLVDYNGSGNTDGDDLADFIADFFDSIGTQPGFPAPIPVPGGFAGNATAPFTGFGRPCPGAPDVPQPNPWAAPTGAYRANGYKTNPGINNAPCSSPNGDDLADYIGLFFGGCG
jgi:hypothetical protein